MHFKVIVPLYNVEKWIKVCIRSVKAQTHKDFHCVLIDDASTDNSATIIESEIKNDSRFTFIKNEKNVGALENIYNGVLASDPKDEDVIVCLDGDDWLYNQDALSKLSSTYESEGCFITYGSYVEYPSGKRGKFPKPLPEDVIENKSYREHEWCTSALRTFKHHLWKRIKKEDLLDSDGSFYQMAWDLAFMFPMLEMSQGKSTYIHDILYVYNLTNPINDHKLDNFYQMRLEREIRSKTKYGENDGLSRKN